jgi:hypothetical protein
MSLVVPSSLSSSSSLFAPSSSAPYDPSILLDSLPYVDSPPSDISLITDLIHSEASQISSSPEDFLNRRLISLGLPIQQTLITKEFESRAPLMAATIKEIELNGSIPSLSSPLSSVSPSSPHYSRLILHSSVSSFHSAPADSPSKLAIQSELARMEKVSLDLLRLHGSSVWKLHNQQLQEMKNDLTNSLHQVQLEVQNVNKKRKREQIIMAGQLELIEAKYLESVNKSYKLAEECSKMEQQIQSARESKT